MRTIFTAALRTLLAHDQRWLVGVVVSTTLSLSTATFASSHQSDASKPTLEGAWNAVLESPKRPWIFVVTVRPSEGGWGATLTVPGLGDLPLEDVREAADGRVHFRFPPEFDSSTFDGERHGATIVGHVIEVDGPARRTVTLRLTRVVPRPAPVDRVEAWRQDLDVAADQLAAHDRSLSRAARRQVLGRVNQLKREAGRKSDAEILVALSQAVALADNGHTWLRLSPTRQGTFAAIFPIRVWWFSDGPYVIRASAEYGRALGCRLVAIDGHDVAHVRRGLHALSGGTSEHRDYLNPLYLMLPDVLGGLGLIEHTAQASFTFEDAHGSRFALSVRAERRPSGSPIQELWQELSPLIPSGTPAWATALDADSATLPLYLRHPDRPYWSEFLAEPRVLYVQYNRATNADTGPSFDEFAQGVLATAARQRPRAVVIDLRLSSGGNLFVAKEAFQRLSQVPTINQPGRLFVITGPVTFSAGLYHAAQLRQLTKATFVGDTVGDRLDYWAEGGRIELPNSGVQIDYANGFHRYSRRDYPERRPYYEELHIDSLAPDVAIPTTSRDYLARRDPVLEGIVTALGPP